MAEKTTDNEGEVTEPPDEPPGGLEHNAPQSEEETNDKVKNEEADENKGEEEEEEENAELNWAKRHIREKPVTSQHDPGRSPGSKPEPEPEPDPDPEKEPGIKPAGSGGRGKGRPPKRMLKEAAKIAKNRGGIILVQGSRSDSFDIIVCEEFRTIFIRLRWCDTRYLSSSDVLTRFARDIGRILRQPLTGIIAWELWLREPQDTWQYFLITRDSIVEIREDGTIYYRPMLLVPVAEEAAEAQGSRGAKGETGRDADP